MARKFLYFIAFCIALVIGGPGRGFRPTNCSRMNLAAVRAGALRPNLLPVKPLEANAYEDPALWYFAPLASE